MFDIIKSKSLSTSEVFSLAFSCFKKLSVPIFELFSILFLPMIFLQAILLTFLEKDLNFLLNLMESDNFLSNPNYLPSFFSMVNNQVLLFMVSTFIGVVGVASINKLTFDFISTEKLPVSNSASAFAFSMYGSFVIVQLTSSLLISISALAFIIPAIYFSFIWLFSIQAVAFRGKKGFQALKYSSILVKNNVNICLMVCAMCYLLQSFSIFMFSSIQMLLPDNTSIVTLQVISCSMLSIITVFVEIVKSILFLNLEANTFGIDPLNTNSI